MIARIFIVGVLALSSLAAQEQPFQALAAIESQRVFVGQAFVYQVQIQGSDQPSKPDLSALEQDFTIQDAGGGAQNSSSVTIINGRMSQVVRKGYTYSYRLIPKRAGTLVIPSVTVEAEGRTTQTNPQQVFVSPPAEIEDFKLRMTVSETKAYVGQPIVLATTWFIGRNVDQFSFVMPVLEDDRFQVIDPRIYVNPAQQSDYLDVLIGDKRATAKKGHEALDGREFVTVRFEKALIPKTAGAIRLPSSTVSFRALREDRRGRSQFGDFFGDSFFGSRRSYESLAVPSNRPAIEVLPLPTAGRPANFSGLIGEFEFEVEASPTHVNVGDPITLTVRISGPRFLDYVRLPPLQQQMRLAADFKIPEEMAPGEIRRGAKVFTQTIRAKHSQISEAPPLEISYFHPGEGQYVTARTEAIPLVVEATRIITANDVEGLGDQGVIQSELETQEEGIAYNYEDSDALEESAIVSRNAFVSPLWMGLLLAPPLSFLGLLLWTSGLVGKRDLSSRAAQQAVRELGQVGEEPDEVLKLTREYLGARLRVAPGALTFDDVADLLRRRGVADVTLKGLKALFDACEAGRYAGGSVGGGEGVAESARRVVAEIEGVR